MANRDLYRGEIFQTYMPFTREMTQGSVRHGLCAWCDSPLRGEAVMFCTDECRQQYLVRAIQEDMRKAVRERDSGICEWCGRDDVHYAIVNKIAVSSGGGACGVEELLTLCSACVDGHNAIVIAKSTPAIPDMVTRTKWRGLQAHQRKWRHLIAPVLVSHTRWTRVLHDYAQGAFSMGVLASARSHEHLRMCRMSRRWWRWWLKDRHRDKTLQSLVSQTVVDLEAQMFGAIVWIGFLRKRKAGYLE